MREEDSVMASELSGMRVAFLTANEGVEQVELTAPWQAVKDAGGARAPVTWWGRVSRVSG
jgi:putative intracellular protease/amidase